METELNIVEILKDKPKGTKLYSPLFGDVYLLSAKNNAINVEYRKEGLAVFFGNGKYYNYSESELLLFPSKEMRDWSKFAWKKGDVLQHSEYPLTVIFESFEDDTYTSFKCKYCFDFESNKWLVSNSNCSTKHFYKVSDEEAKEFIRKVELNYNGKLKMDTLEIKPQPEFKDGDAEKKQIVDLKPNDKLKPFDKVLVRDCLDEMWRPSFFACYLPFGREPYQVIGGEGVKLCIPYEGNESLLGTRTEI